MPITVSDALPARRALEREGLVAGARSGPGRGGRLAVALLNLMPTKEATETQIARLLGATPFEVSLTLVVPDGYRPRNTPLAYLDAHYRRFSQVRGRRFDGLVVTGAPIEHLPFEAVAYWDELRAILDWSIACTGGSFHICWGAQAALHHHHGVPKRALPRKCSGVFRHRNLAPEAALMNGVDPVLEMPVSRHTEVRVEDLPRGRGLSVLSASDESGLALVEDRPRRSVYLFNHLEYDAGTLAAEYRRDRAAGLDPAVPAHYFPGNDPDEEPVNTWRHHGVALFRNWLRGIASDRRVPRAAA